MDALQSPGDDVRRQLCTRQGAGSCIGDQPFGFPTVEITQCHFELSWSCSAVPTIHRNPVGSDLFKADSAEVCDYVWGDIGAWVRHLVQQLLRTRTNGDGTSRSRKLADDSISILCNVSERETQSVQAFDRFRPWIGEVASGDLTAAFEEMTNGSRLTGETLVVIGPSEGMAQRTYIECGVSHSAGDNDLSAPKIGRASCREEECV